MSWQTGWHPVFCGLASPICCCAQSFWCGRFSTPFLVTQRLVVYMRMQTLCNFLFLFAALDHILVCVCDQVIKREPGSLGARCWSLYGRCYLRHFNELDHELMSRLSKGYKVGISCKHLMPSSFL